MGRGSFMSAAISPRTRFCASVGLKGSMAFTFSRTRSFNSKAMPGSVRALPRFNATPHSNQKNSSKISRNCAGDRKAFNRRRSQSGGGKCVLRSAVHRSGILSWRRMSSGRQSSSGASDSSTRCVMLRNTRVVIFATAS